MPEKRARLKKSAIKRETSFIGSMTEHKDGSYFLFIDVQEDHGNRTKNLHLTKEEVRGLSKFFEFLDFD